MKTAKEQTESTARLWCKINHAEYQDHSVDDDGVIHVKALVVAKPIKFITLKCTVGV